MKIKYLSALHLIDDYDDPKLGPDDWRMGSNFDVEIDGKLFRCPKAKIIDGGSIPVLVQAVIRVERWDRPARRGFVFHDHGYKRYLQIYEDGIWVPYVATKDFCDNAMFYIHEHDGLSWVKRHRVWLGVHTLGASSWNADGRKVATDEVQDDGA